MVAPKQELNDLTDTVLGELGTVSPVGGAFDPHVKQTST
jgi:hypothetical protein